MRREKLKRTRTGADRPVRALRALNGVGAKGSDQVVVALETTGNRMTSTGATNKPFWLARAGKAYRKAVRKHVKCNWALLYIERWLTAAMERDGEIIERTRGTPQGGVISPILSNLFLHYAFDLWLSRTHPDLPWCRYADDGLVHCRTEQEAESLRVELQARLEVCGLQMHPTKTKIVYCKDNRRRGDYPNVTFDFLGYQFRPRRVANSQRTEFFCGYTPAVSPGALKSIRATIRSLNISRQTPGTLTEIAEQINPLLRGWIGYYGRFSPSALAALADYVKSEAEGRSGGIAGGAESRMWPISPYLGTATVTLQSPRKSTPFCDEN
jgi:RNA-directed DNA polymerase